MEEIVPNEPADKAGLQGSDRQVTIDGENINIGGDLITANVDTPAKSMDDIITYLADHTDIGQKVTLEARPAKNEMTQTNNTTTNSQTPVWLGIASQPLTPEINKETNLPNTQTGILKEQVQSGGPADQAGMHGSFKPVLINGQRMLISGNVITAIYEISIANFDDLQAYLQNAKPGQQVKLTILRDGSEQTLTATLAEHP